MRLPLTLRFAYHGVRAAVMGGLILVIGWVAFVPATTTEATRLGSTLGRTYPEGLRQMRAAQVVVAIAPDPVYDLAARVIGPQVSGWMVRLAVSQMAAGNVPRLPESPVESDR
ncbi:hypothetical protein, partial [Yoonia sp.]|uniref:hypothetical protein n=1 Tax=Yoonia sp. TaxID=2212373 RepID=UPI002FD9E6FD